MFFYIGIEFTVDCHIQVFSLFRSERIKLRRVHIDDLSDFLSR